MDRNTLRAVEETGWPVRITYYFLNKNGCLLVKTLCLILLHSFEEGKSLHKSTSFEVLRKAWLKAVVFEFIDDFSSLDKSLLPHKLV